MRRLWKPRLLLQLALFLLLATNVELYCLRHLISEGYETGRGFARLDPVTGWMPDPGPGKNSIGLWGPEVPWPRPPHEFRILCLGGSVTAAWGVDAVTQSYAKHLEDLLQAQAPPGLRIRVMNGGVAGFSVANSMSMLAKLGPHLQPDIVTVMSAYNEASRLEYQPVDEKDWLVTGSVNRVKSLLYHSATYRYLRCKLLRPEPFTPSVDRSFGAISTKNLRYMNQYMQSHGGRLVVLFEAQQRNIDPAKWAKDLGWRPIPDAMREELREAFARFGQESHVPYLDMDPVLRQGGRTEAQNFLDAVHLTPEAHRLEAEAIARTLWDNHMVPRADGK